MAKDKNGMNFYVYSRAEIEKVFFDTFSTIRNAGSNCEFYSGTLIHDTVELPWHHMKWGRLMTLFYPSTFLWNRKLRELLCPVNFPTINAFDADYFVVPIAIECGDDYSSEKEIKAFEDMMLKCLCYNLPYWQYNNKKHVFFIVGDSHKGPKIFEDSCVFRTSCHKNSNDRSLYYDVLLDISFMEPIEECSNICAFMGCLETHQIRRHLPISISKVAGKVYFESTPNFFHNLPDNVREKMSAKWRDVLQDSQFIVSPRGCGLGSIRFFEALAFGRIPVKIADSIKLPLESIIDYDKFVVSVPENEIDNIASAILEFREKNDLSEASKLARKTWERYFSCGKLRQFLELNLPQPSIRKQKLFL